MRLLVLQVCKFWIWFSDQLGAAPAGGFVVKTRRLAVTHVTWPSLFGSIFMVTHAAWHPNGHREAESNDCTTFVTTWTGLIAKMPSLSSPPRKHIRESTRDPCQLQRWSPKSYQDENCPIDRNNKSTKCESPHTLTKGAASSVLGVNTMT